MILFAIKAQRFEHSGKLTVTKYGNVSIVPAAVEQRKRA
ncbi:hypothetical protein B4098_0944 [Heyndrickxia coagulans]|uniref:Uncharacterized protein n=1 Tax=Heyndrickxia coagulans TaxID=1398 RepID=A0A150K839_HEYCO|nr:hypothetical protein B4098_0944 [Heyndrickxia coagulans]